MVMFSAGGGGVRFPSLKTLTTVIKRGIRGSGSGRPPSRPVQHFPRILLEKFVKIGRFDGSILVKCPFDVKIRGSFFDAEKNVDRTRNNEVSRQLRKTQILSENPAASLIGKADGDATLDVARNAGWTFEDAVDRDQREMFKNISTSIKEPDEVADDDLMDSDVLEELLQVPLHILFYGRSNHRLDSYSIMNNRNQHQTHVYISDASGIEETVSMFNDTNSPVGSFSIWQPKFEDSSSSSSNDELHRYLPDELTSGFKIYVPPHFRIDSLKSVFLVPTVMSKVFLEADRQANVELDASLIRDLEVVWIMSETGNIKVSDLQSQEIRLGSKLGNVTSDGLLDGYRVVSVELIGNGDFIAKDVDGGSLTVTTDTGNVQIWGECCCSHSHFFTRSGNVAVNHLYNQSFVSIKERGNFYGNIVKGSLNAVIKKGEVDVTIHELTDHSTIHVTDGNVIVTVPKNLRFRINATAPTTSIAPKILNSGDMFFPPETKGRYEVFTTAGFVAPKNESGTEPVKIVSFHETEPTLNMITNRGKIVIKIADEDSEEENSEEGHFTT